MFTASHHKFVRNVGKDCSRKCSCSYLPAVSLTCNARNGRHYLLLLGEMKYVVVTGGVVSGIGKGITISSLGRVLKSMGARVSAIKIDPYLNIDAGTMSPFEHGETFVLDDGGETDLDLGNYERFLDVTLTRSHNITTGRVYNEVLTRERRGDYLGKTVQIIPHITDMVQKMIVDAANMPVDKSNNIADVCLIEVGGTVGDIESMVFLEALRQFQVKVGKDNIMFIHVSLVPVLGKEDKCQKTKPTQHSVKELRSIGLSPDMIICRSQEKLSVDTMEKLSLFCQVPPQNVVSIYDVSNVYHIPLILVEQGIHSIIKDSLKLNVQSQPDLTQWASMAAVIDNKALPTYNIAIVGKYTDLSDSYLSLTQSITHSAVMLQIQVQLNWVVSSDLEPSTNSEDSSAYETAWSILRSCDGMIVPGGFGVRGVEGKILAAKYARESRKPFLGICLGMQVMVIEYARSVLGFEGANSEEFDNMAQHKVVIHMPEISQEVKGGTMRLGKRQTFINDPSSLAALVYGTSDCEGPVGVDERHRHRYEVNPEMIDLFDKAGLKFSGKDETQVRMEIVELPQHVHPFYFGVQFHPEFKSRPDSPSPPFLSFLAVVSTFSDIGAAGKLRMQHEQ